MRTEHASTWSLLGVPVSRASLAEITAHCLAPRPVASDAPVTVACANLHSLVVAQRDADFACALRAATVVTADGAPLLAAGRYCGAAVGPRVTGSDLFAAIMGALQERGGRAMFVGSTPAVLQRIQRRAAVEYPAITIETLSPPFGTLTAEQNDRILAAIGAFAPDVLWIGMSAPKQEKWVAHNAHRLRVPAVLSVGAVFDFYAGTVARAPPWMRRAGLEWLHRLASEPRRLWRRYLISGPVFVSLVVRERRARGRAGSAA